MSTPIIPPTPQGKPEEKKKDEQQKENKAAAPELPKGSEGSTTLDKDVALEGEVLAFEALERIARMIAVEVLAVGQDEPGSKPRRVWFLDELSLRALELQQASQLQTDHLTSVFRRIQAEVEQLDPQPEREAGVVAGVVAAVGVITSFASLLRTDVTLRGMSVTPSQEAFLNSISRYLLRLEPEIEVRNPNFLVFAPGAAGQASHARILARFNALEEARFAAAAAVEKVMQRVLELQFLIEPPKPKPAPSAEDAVRYAAELARRKPVAQAASKSLEEATTRWTELRKQLDTVTAEHSGFALLARAEELLAWAQKADPPPYFLAARCLSLRANFKTRKGVFTNLGGKDSLSYSGGATATYALFAADARTVAAGTHRYRSPYLTFADRDAGEEDGNSFNPQWEALD